MHTSPLTSLPVSIWRLAATRPNAMTFADIRSTKIVGGEMSRENLISAALRDWLSPPTIFSGPKWERLMKPPFQNSHESFGANTAPTATVTAKAATARPTAPHSRLSTRRRMNAPGRILMAAASPINIPRYLAGITRASATTSASSTRLICPRRMVRKNG
jgi:hypothetical protein